MMNLPAAVFAIRWLIRDTFRQALASGIFWVMAAVSGLCIAVCLSVSVVGGKPLEGDFLPSQDPEVAKASGSGVDVVGGELTLGFGAFPIPLGRDAPQEIRFLELLFAGAVADTAGILMLLICTAGFLPGFLDPSAAMVLMAKPVPRWSLLTGKFLGVVAFVAVQAVLFVGGTWLALGLRTGYWESGYLLCIPLVILHFAVFFSFSVLLAVWTRSTIACVFGSLVFWFLCWGMNYGRHAVAALPHLDPRLKPFPALFQGTVEAGYWFLPKPADFNILLFQSLHAGDYFSTFPIFEKVQELGAFHPEWSILTSLAFAVVMVAIAARQLATTDY